MNNLRKGALLMSRSKYKNLIIVGNGFDCWQGIPTSYEKFCFYYNEHIEEVADSLGCSFYTTTEKCGGEKKITAVELIYGNPFDPDILEKEFFWNLEARMDKLDDQIINLYFGRSEEGRKKLSKAVDEAILLLRRLFCDWVTTFNVEAKDSGFKFSDDCFVINFNYTDTLEKRFGVEESNDFHIHGSAANPDSIIVGHSTHPEKPYEELIQHHFIKPEDPSKGLPRFDGLYAVEDALYRTDKHTADKIDEFCVALMKNGVHIEDIENIYVLGHSFAQADMDYFKFINAVTRCGCNYEKISPIGHLDPGLLKAIICGDEHGLELLEGMILLNIQYAAEHRNRIDHEAKDFFADPDKGRDNKMPYSEEYAKYAVEQRFWFEQSGRTQEILNGLARQYCVPVPEGCHSILSYMDYVDYGHDQRKRNAKWHISYYSNEDQKRIKKVLRDLHVKNYTLYPTIDECIAEFAQSAYC